MVAEDAGPFMFEGAPEASLANRCFEAIILIESSSKIYESALDGNAITIPKKLEASGPLLSSNLQALVECKARLETEKGPMLENDEVRSFKLEATLSNRICEAIDCLQRTFDLVFDSRTTGTIRSGDRGSQLERACDQFKYVKGLRDFSEGERRRTRMSDIAEDVRILLHDILYSVNTTSGQNAELKAIVDGTKSIISDDLEGQRSGIVFTGTIGEGAQKNNFHSGNRHLHETSIKEKQYHANRQNAEHSSKNTMDGPQSRFGKVSQEDHESELSDPPSVFSLQSMQSTTVTTNTTNFSESEIGTVLGKLVRIFMHDEELRELFLEAFVERRIAPARCVRKFKRLLKRFAADLKEESQEAIDIDLANLISSRATLISDEIGSRFEQLCSDLYLLPDTISRPDNRSQSGPITFSISVNYRHIYAPATFKSSLTEGFDDDASCDDEDEHEPHRAFDEKFIALVAHGRDFIQGSSALQKLRGDFKKFVMSFVPNRETLATINYRNGDVLMVHSHEVRSWLYRWAQFGFTWIIHPHEVVYWLYRWSHFGVTLIMQTRSSLKKLLSDIGLLEKAVPENHRRLRWTNRHGKKLYDDYVEHRPGALKALQEYLTSTPVPADPNNSGSSQSQSSSRAAAMYTPGSRSLSSGVSTSSSINATIQSRNPASNTNTTGATKNIKPGGSSTDPLLLLFCIERRGHPIKLYQEFVTDITDDRELFHSLRNAYHSRRTKFKSFWSLRTLHGIHFMKFAYGGHGFIDVRRHPEPCVLGKPCACIPPADRVVPQGKEYACQPIPSELSPPIGPKAMMDCFKDPDSRIAGADWVLQQLPKKIGSQLDPNKPEMSQAWGIYYQEDWDWMRIWVVLGIAFFPPSLLFGVLWGILKQDIQGAFGVASWWMAGATIGVGIIGSYTSAN